MTTHGLLCVAGFVFVKKIALVSGGWEHHTEIGLVLLIIDTAIDWVC